MGGAEAVAGGAFGWGGAPGATAGGGEEAEEAGVDLERGLHCAGAAFGAGGDAEAGGGNGLADEEGAEGGSAAAAAAAAAAATAVEEEEAEEEEEEEEAVEAHGPAGLYFPRCELPAFAFTVTGVANAAGQVVRLALAPGAPAACGGFAWLGLLLAPWVLAPPPFPTVAPTCVPTVHSLPRTPCRCLSWRSSRGGSAAASAERARGSAAPRAARPRPRTGTLPTACLS
jgi:hypothetical protein